MIEVRMPKFGLSMEKGFITKWYKKEGDPVKEGEPLFEVESEKITNDVPSPGTGFLKKIVVPEGEEQAVGEVVAYVAENEEELKEEVSQPEPERTEKPAPEKEEQKKKAELHSEAKEVSGGFVKASPRAKKLAREYGIDLSTLKGSGPGGRIIEKDVLKAVSSGKAGGKARTEKLSPLRKTIARNLSESYRESVLVTNATEVDMSALLSFKNSLSEKISVTAILVKVLALALKKFPKFNANFNGEEITYFDSVNIGIAVSTENGLVVPVIKNVEAKSLSEVNAEVKELARCARENKLSEDDVKDSHFTLTNLGMMRTELFTPVLNPGEAGILGVGRTVKKPVVIDEDKIAIRPMCWLSLSYDHRVIDGADAAGFLGEIASLIENSEIYDKI